MFIIYFLINYEGRFFNSKLNKNMNKLMEKVLTAKVMRNTSKLSAFALMTTSVRAPWAD